MALAVWMNEGLVDIRRAKEDGTLKVVPFIGFISGDTFYAICNDGGVIESYDTVKECQDRIEQAMQY